MKNYWTDDGQRFFLEIQTVVETYKNLSEEDQLKGTYWSNRLHGMFRELGKKILEFSQNIKFDDEDDVIKDCVSMCFAKIRRFDPAKGKAVNFFVTCMLGHMRQIYMAKKNMQRIKEANA